MPRRHEAVHHRPRSSVESDRVTRRRNRHRQSSNAPEQGARSRYFVPSFAVRRPIVITPELDEYRQAAREVLPRRFSVDHIGGITVIEQYSMKRQFWKAGLLPDPEMIERAARMLAVRLGENIKGTPRAIDVPLGRVDRYGSAATSFGAIPEGWRGFDASYARRGTNNKYLAPYRLASEAVTALGSLTVSFAAVEDDEFVDGFNAAGLSRTPHFSIAKKVKKGAITNRERVELAPALEEILPDHIKVFDPVITLQLEPGGDYETIFVRNPKGYEDNGLVDFMARPT